jgi:4-amino-4-deoxy-L-arabinose transferase-like glycosyltransferase
VTLGRKVALWAATLVLLCKYFVDGALSPRMDMLLVLFVTGAALSLQRASALQGHPRSAMLVGAAMCIALATMCKGPLGAFLPGLAITAYLVLRRRWRELFTPAMIVTFAAGLGPWILWSVAAYSIAGGDFFQYQVVEGLFLRFLPDALGGSSNCHYAPYVYGKVIFSQCLPWSLFLPALVALMVDRRTSLPEPLVFVAVLFTVVLGFFTLSSGRCVVYVLPCVPALAAMMGYLLSEMTGEKAGRSATTVALFNGATVMVALAALVLIIVAVFGLPTSLLAQLHPTDRALLSRLGRLGTSLYLWITVSLIGALTALAGALRSYSARSVSGVLMVSVAGTFLWFYTIDPALAQRRSFKSFAAVVDSLVSQHAVIEFAGASPPCDLRFYLSHQLERAKQAYRLSPFLLLSEDDLRRLNPEQRTALQLLARSPSPGENLPRLVLMKKAHESQNHP